MAITRDHDLHRRRLGRNIGVFGVLVAFALLVFGLTIAKVSGGGAVQAYDHTPRSLDPARALAPVTGRGE